MPIHPTAIIDKQAHVPPSADIGPHVVIEGPVKIGEQVKVYPNAYISGWTEVGDRVQIHPGAVVGHLPQDFNYGGQRSYCKIGAGTVIREFASIHRGTQPESWTTLGEECFILGYAHIGHNCTLGDRVKLYNNSLLAGHVSVGDDAIISGGCLVHQFCRVGSRVMAGGGTRIIKDIPPFMTCLHESRVVGINAFGMRRSKKYSLEELAEVKDIYKLLYRSGLHFRDSIKQVTESARTSAGQCIAAFLNGESKRGFAGPIRDDEGESANAENVEIV